MALVLRKATPLASANRTSRHVGRPALRCNIRKVVIRASVEPTSVSNSNESLQKVHTAALEAWTWVKTKWETTEDSEKPAVIAILGGVAIAQIAIGATVDVVDHIPVVNTLLKLVGSVVTGYFIFKLTVDPSERDSVKSSFADFLEKVAGEDKI